VTLSDLKLDVVILACAVSAGIHGALVPEHFDEGAGAGLGFVAATALLAAAAVLLTLHPSPAVPAGTAALFAGLIVAYLLAVTTGVPVVHPERESVEGIALFTKAVEGIGFVLAASLVRQATPHHHLHTKGHLT